MEISELLLIPTYLMLPALVPNSVAALTGGGTPMDFGRSWRGKRVLGDGKTWRGFFIGAAVGIFGGFVELFVTEPFSPTHFGFGSYSDAFPLFLTLSFGALMGDVCGAFIKRRLGYERGHKVPILDQYDSVIGAVLLTAAWNSGWLYSNFIADYLWIGSIIMMVIVYLLHRGLNWIGYKIGRKDVPW